MAKLLSREKQDIILMDDNEEKLSTLNSNFDLMTATASPTSIKGLKEVGVGEADLFIAVTPDESRNMTACRQGNRVLHPHELGTPMVGILRRSLDTDRHQDARKSRDTEHPPP